MHARVQAAAITCIKAWKQRPVSTYQLLQACQLCFEGMQGQPYKFANLHLYMCCCLQMVVEDGCFSAALMESNIVSVSDMVSETSERLEFRDAVVKMSIGEVLLGASGMYKGCPG